VGLESADPVTGSDELAELRTLLVGRERDQLAAIEHRLDDKEALRREVGAVLPAALLGQVRDPHFTRALAPGVERALTASVRQNPAPLADALFPVMGPAIRKAVAAALATMVDSLNRTLELSVSWRSVAWRYEALRTGKPFAEVALLHTLRYRVEQIFLIETASGLLLQHLHPRQDEVKDADMVSGMLTAIRDFVHDSFRLGKSENLEALKVGELSVWIEQGPRAVIAAVIRGEAPLEFRERLQSAIETIHLEFAEALEDFKGDTAAFEAARPILEHCFHTEYRTGDAGPGKRAWFLAGAVVTGLAIWLGFSLRTRARWNDYLDRLRAEPGIVVVSSGRDWGRFVVTGLRDPLARDPMEILRETPIAPQDVDATWKSFYASDQALALARARQVLRPPPDVTLTLDGSGVLSVGGAVRPAWLADAGRMAPLIPGVTRLDASQLLNGTAAIASRLQSLTPLFEKGQAVLTPGQQDVVTQLVSSAEALQAIAVAANQRFKLEIVGHTDADGLPEANLALSEGRAAVIRAALEAIRPDRLEIVTSGVGSRDPASPEATDEEKQLDRRVTVRVTPLNDPASNPVR
jgi:OOP family OmpA-OmpF porin